MRTAYLISQDQTDYSWRLVDTMPTDSFGDLWYLADKFVKKLGIDAKPNRYGEFLCNHQEFQVVNDIDWKYYYSKKVINND